MPAHLAGRAQVRPTAAPGRRSGRQVPPIRLGIARGPTIRAETRHGLAVRPVRLTPDFKECGRGSVSDSPRVIYSIGARLGGGGIGWIAFQAVRGIYRSGLLDRLLVSSSAQSDIPPSLIRQWGWPGRGLKFLGAKDSTGLIEFVDALLFDAWTAAHLPDADIFHGWNGLCLHTLRRAKARGLLTVVDRASSHPRTQRRLLHAEAERWGMHPRLPRWNYRRSLRDTAEADYVVVPSAFAWESHVAEGVPAERLIESPFGVDLDHYVPATESGDRPFRALFAGQVTLRKGVPDLLAAWARLGWTDAELWIAGNPSAEVRRLLPRFGAASGVRWFGHVRNLAEIMREVDCFVFPSIEEGSALVTYEALATGLPVVTTASAGSVVRHEQDGFIVPVHDPETVADSLRHLRDDPTLRQTFARSARRRAEGYPWDAYGSRLVAAYRRIADASLSRPARPAQEVRRTSTCA